jgi:hypothetical protein
VTNPAEAQVDAVVGIAVTVHAIRYPGLDEEPDAVSFQDAGAHRLLDLEAGAVVHDHGFDSGRRKQVRQHQPCGATAHDADGGVGKPRLRHGRCPQQVPGWCRRASYVETLNVDVEQSTGVGVEQRQASVGNSLAEFDGTIYRATDFG